VIHHYLLAKCFKFFISAAKSVALMAIAGCAVTTPTPPSVVDAPITVYSAGSLRDALTSIALDYEKLTGQKIALTFGASGLLRERIEKGEPAQVFTSADTAHPAKLASTGQWRQRRVFARNTLCAIAQEKLPVTTDTLLDVMLNSTVRVGSSTPKADPSGDYVWELFRKAETVKVGSYEILNAKTLKFTGGLDSLKPPIGKGAYAWAMENNSVDLFLLYCTNAVSTLNEVPALKLQMVEVPDNLKIAAAYGLTVQTSAP
jgi:molybdate transport system substrate-binding protein